MKKAILLCLVTPTLVAGPANLLVTPRDANSSEVTWTDSQTSHSYVSVGTGLNYKDESGAWRESQDLIEPLPDGSAAALRGPHKVHFGANLNTSGVISLTTVSNRVLRSHPVALYYLNAQTGERALVARIKDSIGEIHPPNQLVYPDCLEGAKADYRLTYTKSGMEADLVLLEQLPPPEAFFGTNRSVRLEWVTEFLDPPAPQIRTNVLKAETDPALRQSMAEPDLIDDTLDFGDTWFPLGSAFEWDAATRSDSSAPAEIRVFNPATETNHISVAKRWQRVDQTTTLVESVDWSDIAPKLAALPQAGRVASASGLKEPVTQGHGPPERPPASKANQTIKLASLPYRVKGYVLDYITVTSGTGYTFATGVTYYIGSSATFSEMVSFQPNCIIKFTNNAYLLMFGQIVCNGTASLPSILTSKDDDLFGESILYSNGHPTFAASQAMWVYYVNFNTQIQYAKIRWAQTGIQYDANPLVTVTHTLQNSTFQQCTAGVYANLPNATLNLSSVIKCGVTTPISCPGSCAKMNINGSMIEDCAGDTDSDGLPDNWETLYFGTLNFNGVDDLDGDGLTNSQEYQGGTDPTIENCPRDAYEAAIGGQSPNAWFKLNDTDPIPDLASLADAGTGHGPPLANSGAYSDTDLFDKTFGAVAFDDNSDVLTAGDLINGGASMAPAADQTATGSVSLLFRTLGDLTQFKCYVLSQGASTTASKNAFHVYFDKIPPGRQPRFDIGIRGHKDGNPTRRPNRLQRLVLSGHYLEARSRP